jgi:predicted permease
VAKKMGGDADFYADILAWQILLSMLTLPAFMVLLSA